MATLPLTKLDRPREKLLAKGAAALTDEELLAVVLGSGTNQTPVLALSRKILRCLEDNSGKVDGDKLRAIAGVGPVKAMVIEALIEFANRRASKSGYRITRAEDAYNLMLPYANRKQEHLICLSLNGAHEVLNTRVVTVGLVNESQVHPREVFADAIVDRATAVILGHNHPSGMLRPSADDIAVTRRLVSAGRLLGVSVADHLIFTNRGFYSFKRESDLISGEFKLLRVFGES